MEDEMEDSDNIDPDLDLSNATDTLGSRGVRYTTEVDRLGRAGDPGSSIQDADSGTMNIDISEGRWISIANANAAQSAEDVRRRLDASALPRLQTAERT